MFKDKNKKFSLVFKSKFFRLVLLFFILAEELSLFSYLKPGAERFIFIIISLIAVFLTLRKLEYGLYLILGELFIGSKGYLFYFNFSRFSISIRLALFIIVFIIWIIRLAQNKISFKKILKLKFFDSYILLFLILSWGLIWGAFRKNSFKNIFFDANAWLFFLMFFVFLTVIKNWQQIKRIIQIGFAAMIDIFLKTTFLFIIFSRGSEFIKPIFYYWLRATGVGEITQISSCASRIFIQSQIYSLIFFFIVLSFWLFNQKKWKLFYSLIFITSFPVLVSFSRSFWLGLIVGLVVFFVGLKIKKFLHWRKTLLVLSKLFLVFFIELILIFILVTPFEGINLAKNRLKTNEPAISNRVAELKPLFRKIAQHPLIGSGFGTTITYKPKDPRTIEKYGNKYTTYAFEWGYLDICVKIGLIGLAIYLFLIFKIWRNGWQIFSPPLDNKKILIFGLITSLVALLVVNLTSPYLNHPLGISYIILCTTILTIYYNKKAEDFGL